MTDSVAVSPGDAQSPLVLALDIGTSSARAIVFDAQGHSVEGWEVHRPYDLVTTPDGGVVARPDPLVDLVAQCIDAAMHVVDRPIAAVACSTFWHSLIGVDAHGQAVTPVLTWADTRSREAARRLRGALDSREIHARTGCVVHSSYWPAKLVWLRDTDPDLAGQVRFWMSFAEYLYLKVFGERRVSISMASGTGLLDQQTCGWDSQLLDFLHLEPDTLSPLADFTDCFQGPQGGFAGRWAQLRDVPWYLALGDGACNNIGSGGFCPEWAVAMIGTSGALRVVREVDRVHIPWGLWSYRVDRRRIVQGGALSDGGNVFAWLQHSLRIDTDQQLEGELASVEPDAHGLTVLPFLAGERSPDWNVDAKAAMVGMTLDTSGVDIARAWLEAITYRFAIIYDMLTSAGPGLDGIIGSGGGLVHSPVWMQIMTDVLGTPMVTSKVAEASSRGAAVLALEALGAIAGPEALPAPLGDQHQPNKEHTTVYRKAMERQCHLYDLLLGGPEERQHQVRAVSGARTSGHRSPRED